MPHYKHSIVIFIVAVGAIVCELSACGSRLAFLPLALLLMLAKLATISAFLGVVLSVWSSMKAPPSSKLAFHGCFYFVAERGSLPRMLLPFLCPLPSFECK